MMPEKKPLSLFFSFLRNPLTPRGKGNSKSLKNFIFLFLFSMVIDFFLDQLSGSYWLIDKLKVLNTESRAEEILFGWILDHLCVNCNNRSDT